MPKQTIKQRVKTGGHPAFFTLVPKKPLENIVPVVTGPVSHAAFAEALKNVTGRDYVPPTVETTPTGRTIRVGEEGESGVTASGSKLIYSPSKKLTIEVATPHGKNRSSVDLYLLVREKDYVKKTERSLFSELKKHDAAPREPLFALASNVTRATQVSRKKARAEISVVGKSAKQIVFDYFKACNVDISQSEIEKEKWNLCHLLSYAIAMNAKTASGDAFDTQTRKNLFSGTRVFNENMMRIENVLLEMIKKNDVAEIEYMSVHSEFENSHILASLTLKVGIRTFDGRSINFDYPFDVADDRRLSTEASTVYYATMMSLVNASVPSESVDGKPHFGF